MYECWECYLCCEEMWEKLINSSPLRKWIRQFCWPRVDNENIIDCLWAPVVLTLSLTFQEYCTLIGYWQIMWLIPVLWLAKTFHYSSNTDCLETTIFSSNINMQYKNWAPARMKLYGSVPQKNISLLLLLLCVVGMVPILSNNQLFVEESEPVSSSRGNISFKIVYFLYQNWFHKIFLRSWNIAKWIHAKRKRKRHVYANGFAKGYPITSRGTFTKSTK